jgi:hypothetical protein
MLIILLQFLKSCLNSEVNPRFFILQEPKRSSEGLECNDCMEESWCLLIGQCLLKQVRNLIKK